MITKEATIQNLEELTEMNVKLRDDEKIDNLMPINQVKERMQEFLNDSKYCVLIFEDNEQIIGYSLINTEKRPMYLRQLFIKKEFRNLGYGKTAINKIVERLNIEEIDIDVMIWNESAIGFYLNYGFKKRYLGMRYTRKE
jgi:ribosomal protein S18 acetylase RimI-like enzyme